MAGENEKLSFISKFGFGVGDFASNLYFQGAGLFLLFYYTDVLGIPVLTAGYIYMLALIWDGISDPMMGYYASRTKSRFGKYRPYILFGCVPLAVSYVSMYYIPDAGLQGLIWYAAITHLIFRTAYTVVSIPYSSLSATMTQDSGERGKLAAFRMVFAVSGGLAVAILTKDLVAVLGKGNESTGFLYVSVIYALFATGIFILTFFMTNEKVEDQHNVENYTLRETFGMILKNPPFLIISLVVVLSSITYVMTNKVLLYYFKYNLQNEAATKLGLFSLLAVVLIGVPFWAWVSSKIGKRNVYLIGGLFSIVSYIALYLNPGTDLKLVLLNLALVGIGTASGVFTFWAIIPDTVEYGEWKSALRAESFIFGLASLCQKVSLGIGLGIVGFLLDFIEYKPNVAQSPATLQGIVNILTIIPLVGITLSMVAMYFYDLSGEKHKKMVVDIQARKERSN